jgi:hypothetical protein
MIVPFAKKWQKETDQLREIAVDCDLTEALKWGKPCFTFQKKNVAIVIPLKESCAFSFFKGALLKDPKHILERIGDHTQAARWIKFTSLREVVLLRSTLRYYIFGVALTLALSRLIAQWTAGSTNARDPLSVAGSILVLTSAALLASAIPARRAANLEPVRAIRLE